jgi:hypothetical protein
MTELYWSDFTIKDPPEEAAPFRDVFSGEGELRIYLRCQACNGRGYLPRALFSNAIQDRTCQRCMGKKGGYIP